MSDDRLQQLKRAWEASGSVEDEAAYLVERERCGELCAGALRVLAELGYPAARMAVPEAEAAPALRNTQAWVARFHLWPVEAIARVMVAAWSRIEATRDEVETRAALDALEVWITCPCEKHAADFERQPRFGRALVQCFALRSTTAGLLAEASHFGVWPDQDSPLRMSLTPEERAATWDTIRHEVVAGLLGYAPDPVAERVRARTGA